MYVLCLVAFIFLGLQFDFTSKSNLTVQIIQINISLNFSTVNLEVCHSNVCLLMYTMVISGIRDFVYHLSSHVNLLV
jgi:hypothetical protein